MMRKIRNVLIILAIIAVLAYLIPLPCWVNTTLKGVRWTNNNPSHSETAEITVKGTYLRYLFRDNTFEGTIEFPGVDAESYVLTKTKILKNWESSLWYYSKESNHMEPKGSIMVKGAFKKVIIRLNEKDENGNYDYISAPATDRQSAIRAVDSFG